MLWAGTGRGKRRVRAAVSRLDAYLFELLAGVALLATVNVVVLPHDLGFLSIHPNPALFLVAIVASRHGFRGGMMSAVVTAGLAVTIWAVGAQDLSLSTLRTPGNYVLPLSLLALGFVLGALREETRREEGGLRARVGELEGELADQAVRFLAASEAKHELERRVADESASLSNLYAAASAMETLDVERLYPAVAMTARRFLQADGCQLYLLDGELLRLRAAEGTAPPRAELRPDEGLAGFAVRRGRPVSVRDYVLVSSFEELRGAEMLMAAPLLGQAGGLLGCLTVTRLPFLRLTPASLDRLRLVADWAARAIENARAHQRTRARTIEDEIVGAYTYGYYQRRLEQERVRAERYGRPLAVLVFRIHDLELVRPGPRTELGRVLSLVFSRTLRDVDLICRYATDDSFAVILPETTAEAAEAVSERLVREIQGFHFAPYADEARELEFSVRVLPVRHGGRPDEARTADEA